MLKFIRSDLSQLNAYKAHPGSDSAEPVAIQFDRLDTLRFTIGNQRKISLDLSTTY